MCHKDTIELYKYWSELRGDAATPARSAISPAALGKLLPSVMLLEEGENGDTVFRLAGSRLCTLHCAELKGRPVTELFLPEDRSRLTKILNAVQRANALVVLDVSASRQGGTSVAMEVALFPISDEKTRVLGIATIFSVPDWMGAIPAVLELRGVRFLNADAEFAFLQSRPSIPVLRRRADGSEAGPSRLQVISGKGEIGVTRAIRAFRVVQGGKK